MSKSTSADAKAVQLVRELTDILEDAGLVELEYNTENISIRLSRAAAMAAPVAAAPVCGRSCGTGSRSTGRS